MKNHAARTFVASLLTYVLLTSQMAPMAFALNAASAGAPPTAEAKGPELASEKSEGASVSFAPVPVPLRIATAAVAPIISATKTDSFADSDGDGKAEPGEIITYSITIQNTGPDPALNLTLNDTVDPNTNIVGGSAHSTPIAVGDAFNVLGNVRIQVPDGASDLLANDIDPDTGTNAGLTITTLAGDNSAPFAGNSANSGQVTAASGNGSFEYNPPPGFTGSDSFTYIVSDSDGSSQAVTVTLTITGTIWFVNSAAASGGDGRLTSPFNCYTGANSPGVQTCLSATAVDDPGDIIFLFSGSYVGGNTLLNNQRLIGQGATATLASAGGVTVPTFSDALPTTGGASPTITTSVAATNAIPLGQGNLLRGFTVGNTTGAKIFGSNFGTLTVGNNASPDVILNGTGQALNLTTGTLSVSGGFISVATTSSGTQGIVLAGVADSDGAGGSAFSFGSTTVSGSTSQGILIGTTTADLNLGNTSVTGGNDAIALTNNSAGTRTFGTVTTSGNSGIGFLHSAAGGITNVTGATTITNPGGTGISIQNSTTAVTFAATTVNKGASAGTGVDISNSSGNTTFNSLGITTSNGTGLFGVGNTGQINVTTNAGSIASTNGPAINITKAAPPATPVTLNFTSVSSTNSLTTGLTLDRVSGNATIGTTTTTNPTGIGISVTNTSVGGTMNFGNTTSNLSAGTGVNLGTNAGAVTFADLDIAPDPAVAAFILSGSTGTTTSTSGTISTTDAPAVSVTNSPLAMTLTSVTADNTGDPDSCVSLTTASGTLNMQGGTLTGGTGAVFFVSGGNPTVTYSGSITQNSAGRVVDIQGTTGNTITFNTGTITGGASSLGVHIADTTAVNGNVTFSNGLTLGTSIARMTNQAVTIGSGTGTFTLGAVSIFTSSAQGIVATNADGTLNIASGTVDATTARAINIDGPAGLTTLAITLTRVVSTSSTTNGITILDSNGSFTVTGSAGNCTIADQTCTGGSIQTTTAEGILITTTGAAISLAFMKVQNSGTESIHATGSNGFTLNNSIVTDSAGTALDEGIELDNTSGTVTISNCAVSNAPHNGIDVDNFNTNMAAFNLTNSSVTCAAGNACVPAGSVGNDGLLLQMRGTSVLTSGNVQSSTFSGHRATAVQIQTADTAIIASNDPASANNFTVQTSSFTGNNIAMDFTVAQGSSNKFKVLNNATITGHNSHAINVFSSATSLAAARIIGKIQGNTIGTQGTRDSGSRIGNGIRLVVQGNSQGNIEVDNNTIREVVNANVIIAVGQQGVNNVDGTGSANFKITNNVMPAPTGSFQNLCGLPNTPCAENGIFVLADETEPVCAVITGNNIYDVVTMNGSFDVYLAERAGPLAGAQLTIQGTGAVTTFINANNTLAGANKSIDENGNVTTVASCSFPVLGIVGPGELSHEITGNTPGASAEAIASSEAQKPMNIEPERVVAANVGVPSPSLVATGLPFVSSPRDETAKAEETKAQKLIVTSGVQGATEIEKLKPAARAASKPDSKPSAEQINPTPPVIVGDNLTWNVGTLPAGQSVTITFQVQVDNPYTGPANVSNQGTVTATGGISVLTDDPSVGGGSDPTVTPIDAPPDINIKDAKVGEPPSGQTSMLFTVALSVPATGPVSVNFATANGGATPATAGATCDGIADYLTTNGTANFIAGQQIQTIAVPVCSDATAEGDETFLVNLSTPTNGIIVDGQATGTITVNAPGTILISEMRTSGPAGADDDFVEIYNNSNSPLIVAAPGLGLFKMGAGCGDTPVLIGTVPTSTNIPARGHYLMVGSAYSLANYGGAGAAAGNLTLTSNIENDRNVALFSTNVVTNLSTDTRLDAVGFGTNTGNNCDLLREGPNLGALLGSTLQYTFVRKLESGTSQDTNNNAADFVFADTNATLVAGAGQLLGAPGPENLISPLQRSATIKASLVDTGVASTAPPNRVRDLTSDPANNSTLGTLDIRRKFTNNTGGAVTRLRFRIVDITTAPPPGGTADLRGRTSGQLTGVPITGGGTVTIEGTTLEIPPIQTMGGGYNSTMTVTTGVPIAAGAPINVRFLLGVQQTGSFRFFIIVEALP